MPFNLNSSIGTILIDCLHVTRVMEGGGGRAVIRAGNRDTDAITKTQFRDAMQSLIDCRSLNCHKSCRLDLEVWFARTRFNIKEKRVLTTRQNHLMDLITRREAHICLWYYCNKMYQKISFHYERLIENLHQYLEQINQTHARHKRWLTEVISHEIESICKGSCSWSRYSASKEPTFFAQKKYDHRSCGKGTILLGPLETNNANFWMKTKGATILWNCRGSKRDRQMRTGSSLDLKRWLLVLLDD